MRELPARARTFVAAVVAAAVLGAAFAVPHVGGQAGDLVKLGILFGCVSAFHVATSATIAYSVGYIVSLAAVAVVGVPAAGLVGLFGVVAPVSGAGVNPTKRLFNGAQFALAGWGAAAAFRLVSDGVAQAHSMTRLLLAAALASLVYFVINNALVTGVVSLASGMSPRRVFDGRVAPVAATQLGYALVGVLFAEIYVDFGPVAAVFVLAPLLIARQAFANYARQRGAYESTLRALVQAVETKDLYTRGHSERVGKAAQLIARERGLREDRVEIVHYAGMLHDVGKLGVPTRVLQKQGKLNDEEFDAIKLHPLRGYEMLAEIDFLTEALSGVYHHHERMDGRGYPMGLVDDEIPEIARIIMVADAFDSMTSTRSYRQAKTVAEAFTELRRCEGIQFDPGVVSCLEAAVAKHGWEPHAETYFGEQVTRDGRPIAYSDTHDPDPDLVELRLLMGERGRGGG